MVNPKILLVVCGWNSKPYIKACFDGIKSQTYTNYDVVVLEDASTDGTFKEMQKHAAEGWKLISHSNNTGGYISIDDAIRCYDVDYDVIGFAALDDFLNPMALELTAAEYAKGKLTTYSQYQNNEGFIYTDLHYSEDIHAARAYRKDKYRCTGFISCIKEFYFVIPFRNLSASERDIYYNLEMQMSFLEMAGKERIGVIERPIYNYNNNRLDNTANRFGRDMPVYYEIMDREIRALWK